MASDPKPPGTGAKASWAQRKIGGDLQGEPIYCLSRPAGVLACHPEGSAAAGMPFHKMDGSQFEWLNATLISPHRGSFTRLELPGFAGMPGVRLAKKVAPLK